MGSLSSHSHRDTNLEQGPKHRVEDQRQASGKLRTAALRRAGRAAPLPTAVPPPASAQKDPEKTTRPQLWSCRNRGRALARQCWGAARDRLRLH